MSAIVEEIWRWSELLGVVIGAFLGLGALVYLGGMCLARTRRFLEASLGAFVLIDLGAFILAYRYHQSLLDYCDDENRATGGSGLDCLEPYNWPFIYMLMLAWFTVACALLAVVLQAYRRRRSAGAAGQRRVVA